MNKIYTIIGFITYASLQFILFIHYNSLINQLILTCIALFFIAFRFIQRFKKIRKGEIIKIGRNRSAYWTLVFCFLGGLFLFIFAYNYESNLTSSEEVNTSMLTGLQIILLGFLQFDNYLVIFKKERIQFSRKYWWWNDWSYKSIDKLQIGDDCIEIARNGECEYIALTSDERIKMNTLIERLKLIIGDKIIIP